MKFKELKTTEKYLAADEICFVDVNGTEMNIENLDNDTLDNLDIANASKDGGYMEIMFDINKTDAIIRKAVVMEALQVSEEDAAKIIEHLTKHECLEWIDEYDQENHEEPLTDVHYEYCFEDMIDWQYDDAKPSDMLGKSNNINDYPEMLELEDKVIFWYGLV